MTECAFIGSAVALGLVGLVGMAWLWVIIDDVDERFRMHRLEAQVRRAHEPRVSEDGPLAAFDHDPRWTNDGEGIVPVDYIRISGVALDVRDSRGVPGIDVLYEFQGARFLKVCCSSTGREHWIRVEPTCRTVIEALAWTFHLEPEAYAPEVET